MNRPNRFLRLPAVIERVGMSRTAIYREMQTGNFPAQVRIGARAVAWNESDIEAWQQSKLDATRQTNTAGIIARS